VPPAQSLRLADLSLSHSSRKILDWQPGMVRVAGIWRWKCAAACGTGGSV